MNHRVSLGVFATLVTAACAGCPPEPGVFDAGIVRPPFVDGSFRNPPDVTRPDVAPRDYPPPWAGGSLTLPRQTASEPVHTTCGDARPVIARGVQTRNDQMCASGRYLYLGGDDIVRVDLATLGTFGVDDLIGQNSDFLNGNVGCTSAYVTMALDSPRNTASALVEFADVMQPGVVRWSDQRWAGAPQISVFRGFAVSDGLMAWLYDGNDTGRPQLYVAGPHGESPRMLTTSATVANLHADGTHLVYFDDHDIYLFTYGDASAENLTHDALEQASPWISGNEVIWVAAPPDANNDAGTPAASIYAMDLTTRVVTRLDQPPLERAMVTGQPVIAGDWVVWVDARNAFVDGGTLGVARAELYGYNLTTGREYPILTGPLQVDPPIIVGSDVYFACRDGGLGIGDLFTVPLPTP